MNIMYRVVTSIGRDRQTEQPTRLYGQQRGGRAGGAGGNGGQQQATGGEVHPDDREDEDGEVEQGVCGLYQEIQDRVRHLQTALQTRVS